MEKIKRIRLDGNNNDFNAKTKDPMAQTYRYEYALFTAVSGLFARVTHRSLCLDTLRIYFNELPIGDDSSKKKDTDREQDAAGKKKNKKTQKKIMEYITNLVARDLLDNIDFPMMDICAAEVRVLRRKDGTHIFEFTDGIYGFRVGLDKSYDGYLEGLTVSDAVISE